MDVIAGDTATVRVDFLDPDGTLIPDAGSVTYSVRGTDGSLLIGSTSVTTTATDTGVTISVPAINNTINASRQFEKRTILVRMTSGLKPYTYRVGYRVVPFINMTATPNDVRLVFGGSIDEVTDAEIDLVEAYFKVAAQVQAANTYASLDTALSSGTTVEIYANEAIIGTAVFDMMPGLISKMPVSRKEGTSSFQRSAVDFAAVSEQAAAMIARGVAAAAGVTVTAPLMIVTSYTPDPVTYWNGKLSYP